MFSKQLYVFYAVLCSVISCNGYFKLKHNSFSLKSKGFNSALFTTTTKIDSSGSISSSTSTPLVIEAPYDLIIPYLSEHIQISDQLLFVGAYTNLAIQLSQNGYGTRNTGFITCIDEDPQKIQECIRLANLIPEVAKNMANKKLTFQVATLSSMPEICKQSVFDAIVDYAGIDSLHLKADSSNNNNNKEQVLACIDHLQDAVRLGNILVCLSYLEKKIFCSPFEDRFGWVQELDGDPGEISAWYRGKTNIQATKSGFEKLGLKMYVYTNTDNC